MASVRYRRTWVGVLRFLWMHAKACVLLLHGRIFKDPKRGFVYHFGRNVARVFSQRIGWLMIAYPELDFSAMILAEIAAMACRLVCTMTAS